MEWKQQMTDTWLTVKEVAQYLKLSTDLIYKLAQQGRLILVVAAAGRP